MFARQVYDARLDGGFRAGGVHQVLQPHQALLRRPRRGRQPKQVIVRSDRSSNQTLVQSEDSYFG